MARLLIIVLRYSVFRVGKVNYEGYVSAFGQVDWFGGAMCSASEVVATSEQTLFIG